MLGVAFWVAVASTPPSASRPVVVTACRLIIERASRRAPALETLRVSYQITADKSADVVRFVVARTDHSVRAFTARGLFSRGVLIADRLLPADLEGPQESAGARAPGECTATYVHFTDGTTFP